MSVPGCRFDTAGTPVDDILTDAEVERLIAMPKPLPAGYEQLFKPKPKRGHKESELVVPMPDGSKFVLLAREAIGNPLDFSAVLGYERPNGGQRFRLRRYNGKAHEHTNTIEKEEPFYDFHIHRITERYQRRPDKAPESYAEITDRYADLWGAMDCLVKDCNFVVAANGNDLFTSPDSGEA